MSKRVYEFEDLVYVGNRKFRVVSYDETAIWSPEPFGSNTPGYELYEVTGEYFSHPRKQVVAARMVHHLPLSERVRRIEEKLGLIDE